MRSMPSRLAYPLHSLVRSRKALSFETAYSTVNVPTSLPSQKAYALSPACMALSFYGRNAAFCLPPRAGFEPLGP